MTDLGPALPVWQRCVFGAVSVGSAYVCSSMFSWLVLDGRQHAHLAWIDRFERGPVAVLPGAEESVLVRCAYNVALFVLFALHHAGLAGLGARELMQRAGVPRRGVRSVYVLVTAAFWALLVLMWQRTGVYLWDLRGSLPAGAQTAQELVGAAMVAMCVSTVFMHDMFHFFGVRQALASPPPSEAAAASSDAAAAAAAAKARPDAAPELCTTGAFTYGLCRHPMYFYLLCAAVVAPAALSLDRALWFVCAVVFLHAALPREEAKLIEVFGDDYVRYQRIRPAFLPAFVPFSAWLGGGGGGGGDNSKRRRKNQ